MSKKHKQKKERARRERARREMAAARAARRQGSAPRSRRRPAPAPQPRATPSAAGAGPSRYLHERAQRWMLWADSQRGIPSADYVRELVSSGRLSEYKNDPREAGQELAFEAMEAGDREHAQYLAMQALHFDDQCADARRVLADTDATSHIDRVGRLKKALIDEEERLGDVLGEFSGKLSGAVEAMPYLRTRFDLAVALWAAGRQSRGRTHLEALHVEDEDDAVGARYPLLMARLFAGDHEGAAELLDDSRTERAELIVRWARVLQKLLAGEDDEAGALYAELREGREGEANSLATRPPEEFAYPGFTRDEIVEYAGLCLRMLHWAWHADPRTSAWLAERAAAEVSSAGE